MANTTISALPSATTPLSGTEVIPIVQSGVTKKVAASDIAVSGGVKSFQTSLSGLTPSTATAGVVTLAGTLGTASGGTGLTSFTANGVVYASSSNVLATGSALTFDGTRLGIGGAASQLIHAQTAGTTGYLQVQTSIGSAYYGVDSAGVYIGSTANIPSIFNVNAIEQMRLTSTGLGIGTSSPAAPLTIQKASSFIQVNSTGTGATYSRFNNSGGPFIYSGVESSAGASVVPGTSAYSAIFGTDGAYSVQFFTNNSVRATLDSSGNLGIGTTSPNASAILDAQSTTKGVRMPNMTTTQKNAIASPAAGLMVFDTTLAKLCVYSGAAWQTITSV
jgi:hypothetical protein